MSTTLAKTLTPGAYLALSDGVVTTVFVQLKSSGAIILEVAQSLPEAASEVGTVLSARGLREVQFEGLETGDIVYGRSISDKDQNVTVLTPGAGV